MKKISKARFSCLVLGLACLLLAAPGGAEDHEEAPAAQETAEASDAAAAGAADPAEEPWESWEEGETVAEDEVDEDTGGLYIEASGGASRSLDQDFNYDLAVGGRGGDVDFKVGYLIGGAIGFRVNQVRFELASQYRSQEVESITFGTMRQPTGGELDVLTGFANFYYDFDLGWPVRPYLGAGLGIARLDMDAEGREQMLGAPPAFIVDDTENEVAYNAMVGMSIAVAPGTELFLNYRFVSIFDETTLDASQPGISQGDFEMDFSANEFAMGLRYTF